MRVLVTGCSGQVGAAVVEALHGRAEVIAHDHSTLDLAKPSDIAERVREARPGVIVNAAAYTAVDRAQSEPEAARAANAVAPGLIGREARRCGALVIHYSTDYVFDGTKAGPYTEEDATAPLGVYGRTKREGEQALAASGCAHLTLRTSWVYGPRGRNFLRTMLQLAQTRDEVRVVDDQFGAPTSCLQLARATQALLCGPGSASITAESLARLSARPGIYHASASGEVSWHGFAKAIFEGWETISPQPFRPPRLVAIPTRDYPTPTPRPANSRLSNAKLESAFGVQLEPWRVGLDEVLRALASA
jgi:dTDP-4-dehydrorhamnose reductase